MDSELLHLQSWMQQALISPERPGGASEFVRDSARLNAAQHLDIYRLSYIARLRECMKNQFSALAYALGDDLFQMFADDYLNTYPSDSYTLADLGRRFAGHLAATRPAGVEESWPDFMIELAGFEFALSEMFDQAFEENVAPGPDTPDCQLKLSPAVRLFRHRYPVCRYYLDVTKDLAPQLPFEQESFCAATRTNYRIGLSELRAGQYLLLNDMSEGFSAAEALARLVEIHNFDREKLNVVWPEWKKGFLASGFFTQS